jgi:hypothetical protein
MSNNFLPGHASVSLAAVEIRPHVNKVCGANVIDIVFNALERMRWPQKIIVTHAAIIGSQRISTAC